MAAPEVFNNEARAFRNVAQDGDLLVLMRYELPISDANGVSDAWCLYLENDVGCDGTPAIPENPANILPDTVTTSFYTDCLVTGPGVIDCSAGQLELQERTPRIDHALSGAYFNTGHTIVWQDPTAAICVETIEATFAPQELECRQPVWNAAALDTESQQAELGEGLLVMLRNIETERADPINSIVNSSNLVTDNGRVFALEAFNVMALIVPEVFQAASRTVAEAFATPTGEGALQGSLDADNVLFVADWTTIANHYFGMPFRNVTFGITLVAAIFFAALMGWAAQRNNQEAGAVAGSVVFITVMSIGLRMSAVPVTAYFTFVFVASLPMAWWVVGKVRA